MTPLLTSCLSATHTAGRRTSCGSLVAHHGDIEAHLRLRYGGGKSGATKARAAFQLLACEALSRVVALEAQVADLRSSLGAMLAEQDAALEPTSDDGLTDADRLLLAGWRERAHADIVAEQAERDAAREAAR